MRLLLLVIGVLLLLGPLKFLSGLMPAPAYRTGTFKDLALAVSAGATLYGGVLGGVLVLWRATAGSWGSMKGLAVFLAGWSGVMAAIVIALGIWFLHQRLTTGAFVRQGESLALLPIFPIVGGLVGLPIAGGAGLLASGLRRPTA